MIHPKFDDYESFHRNGFNRLTHFFGIPMIVLSIFGVLWRVPVSAELSLNGADILMVLAFLFYCFLDWRLAIPLVFVFWGMARVGSVLPMPLNLGLFVLGWILQAAGHGIFEKRAPAFTKNLIHLMVGPLWVFARLSGFPISQATSDQNP